MKLAYVVPRYGTEVFGGAESGARMLAERLVSIKGWQVEILTTCAVDAGTWADSYPPGAVDLNGVTVRRFASEAGRDPEFDRFSDTVLGQPERADPDRAQEWIDRQGPRNPAVVAAAADGDHDLVIFYPYLYYPTVRGVPAVGRRAILQPAAHDEAPLRLPLFQDVFAGASGLIYHTHGEQALVEQRFPVGQTRQIVVGLGVDESPGQPDAARAALGLDDRPYLLCLGRVDDGKGAGMLARFFAEYKARHPGPVRLVFAGPIMQRPPAHPDIVLAGPVDEATKWGLLRGAEVFVNPSYFESFSIVLMEAWSAGRPVLVNGTCGATAEHVARSQGGLAFTGYASFEATLRRLLGDGGLRAAMAAAGSAYVYAHFRWPVIIDRYAGFLERAAAAVSRSVPG